MSAALSWLWGACGDGPAAPPRTSCDRPNVLLYVVDTLRADGVGRYGSQVETPAVDRLSREGTLFKNAFAPSSWTRASIGSILTGLYPDVHGAEGRNDSLPEHVATLAELFSEHGYTTAAVVANPNVGSFYGFDQGFDEFFQLYTRREQGLIDSRESVVPSDQVTDRVTEWLNGVGCPFFLFVLTIDPHVPYSPPASFDRYGPDYSGPVDHDELAIVRKDLTAEDRERLRSLYHGEISFNDDSMGRLLTWLGAEGLYDDTIVVFTSDHGEEFWEHGGSMHGKTLFQEAVRVPLIIRYPKRVPIAVPVTQAVSLVDVAPTLLELADIPAPYPLDGTSLIPSVPEERVLYFTLDLDGASVKAITRAPWRLIWNQRKGTRLLYNLDIDAGETWNLAQKHPDRVAALWEELAAQTDVNARRQAELRGGEPVRAVREEDLPADARKALEALGYIEETE
jgi:arylsulfatase A-like enzyme